MMVYDETGKRVQFDPSTVSAHLAGCILCGRPVASVGVFIPTNDAMYATVLRLRAHSVRPRSTPCLSYGLCGGHTAQPDVAKQVAAAIEAAAAKVCIQ